LQTFDKIQSRLKSKAAQRFHREADGLEPEQESFIDWVAWELGALYREMGQSRDYVQKNVLQKLTTDMKTRPRPVHTLAQKQPKKHGMVLSPEDAPFTMQRMSAEPPHEIYFTPVRPTVLVNAKVRFRWIGQSLQDVSEPKRPQEVLTTKNGQAAHESVVWWGIELGKDFAAVPNFHFHLDWGILEKNAKSKLQKLLPLIQWYSDKGQLNSEMGYGDYLKPKETGNNRFLDAEYMFLQQLETDILQQYETQFVTVEAPDETPKTDDGQLIFPKEINAQLDGTTLSDICPKSMIWLKMVFPASFHQDQLQQIQLQLNCFPIINRKLDKSKDRSPNSSEYIEIIPLSNADTHRGSLAQTGDYFLGMQKVFAANKTQYRATTFEDFQTAPAGYYALQSGNVEAHDLRDLQTRIAELTHYLQHEAARLQRLPNFSHALSQIENGARDLATVFERIPARDYLPGYYLHIRLVDNQEMVYVRFWVTQGEVAREVVGNSKLNEIIVSI